MAPKVVVPADFGIENLHSQFHGNVVLKLQGGGDMKANSLILSYHSSVFVHLFLELQQSVLEMEDFVGEAVKSFLGALYSGEIQLVRHLFRDVNKLCHVFKVEWLSGRCWDYFTGLVGGVSVHTDYQTLLFLFEEARFCMRVMKCDKFVDLVVQKICGLENRAEIFVEPYMKLNYVGQDAIQLNFVIQITQNSPSFLLHIVKQNIEKQGMVLDETSRFLLQNINLAACIIDNEALFEEVFDTLENLLQLTLKDSVMINKLYRKSVKDAKSRMSPVTPHSSSNTDSIVTVIPNVFSSSKALDPYHYGSVLDFLYAEADSPLIANLYMLIELVIMNFRFTQEEAHKSKLITKLEKVRIKRGWGKISPLFIESWPNVGTDNLNYHNMIKNHGHYFLSSDESFRRVGRIVEPSNTLADSRIKTMCTIEQLFSTEQQFAFNFKHPNTRDCSMAGKCGFMLKVKPIFKSGRPSKFTANLCLVQSEYPEGLHIHPEFVRSEKIHLTVMSRLYSTSMELMLGFSTWNEDGIEYVKDPNFPEEVWRVDDYPFYRNDEIKLVCFINI